MSTRQSSRLATKQVVNLVMLSESSPAQAKKKKKTNAEACRDYRLKRKTDHTKEELYKERARVYNQLYRLNVSEEKRLASNQQAKLRMQAMRARRKAKQGPAKSTRNSDDALRIKWREEKQRQRSEMKENKKQLAWVNRKRRQQYAAKKAEEAQQLACDQKGHAHGDMEQPPRCTTAQSSPHTPAARRKALSRARGALPRSPRKYVSIVNQLRQNASPRKQKIFKQELLPMHSTEAQIGQNVLKVLDSMKKSRSKSSITSRKTLFSACRSAFSSSRSQSVSLRCARRTFAKCPPSSNCTSKPKGKKLEAEIKDFFNVQCIPLPHKKCVSNKTGLPKSVLCRPLADLHKEFQEVTGAEISFAHFAKCRPQHVSLARHNLLRQCLCEYCENLNLKIRVINNMAARINNHCRIRHLYHAADLVTCGRNNGRWQKECAYGTCSSCGLQQLDDHIQPLLHHQGPVAWKRWESCSVEVHGKRSSRKMLLSKEGTMVDLVNQMKEELQFLTGHLYRADWQQSQFQSMRQQKPFPVHTVLMVLDFAENFNCKFQDEVQAAHWYYEQATVHPSVCCYACPLCGETVTESLIFISDDRVHDYNAVHKFNQVAVQHLQNQRGLEVDRIVQWSDGCASQYKSKGPFADVSCAQEDFGCTLERNYFGSRHGKGPADGESAVVKSGAARAVRNGEAVISSAQDLYNFCQNSHLNKQPGEKMCEKHSLRTFFFIPSAEIKRNRNRPVKLVKGTRQLHCIKSLESHKVLTRQLSCSCQKCMAGLGDVCDNRAVAGCWTKETLRPVCANQPVHRVLYPGPWTRKWTRGWG